MSFIIFFLCVYTVISNLSFMIDFMLDYYFFPAKLCSPLVLIGLLFCIMQNEMNRSENIFLQ